jgi:cytochrome P450
MLRFDSPVQSTGRFPHSNVELGGTQIAGGGTVMFVTNAAANRDPAKFPNPDEFVSARAQTKASLTSLQRRLVKTGRPFDKACLVLPVDV